MENSVSDLAFIETNDPNPFHIFNKWREETEQCGHLRTSAMNLATCTRNGNPNSRNVLILKYEADGFIFLTSQRSQKVREINENPNVAATFLWVYMKGEKEILRQVRIKGVLEECSRETTEEIYDKAPLHAKIRSHICKQGEPIKWETLKEKHDKVFNDVVSGQQELEMPEDMIAFKLLPEIMEFYYSYGHFIADRVQFTKVADNLWEHCHVQA